MSDRRDATSFVPSEDSVEKGRRTMSKSRLFTSVSATMLLTSLIAVVACMRAEWSRVMPYLMWNHVAVIVVFGYGTFEVRRLRSSSFKGVSPRPGELFAPWVLVLGLVSAAAAVPNWAGALWDMDKNADGTKVTNRHWHTSADGEHFYESVNRESDKEAPKSEYEKLERGNFAGFARVWVLFSFISLLLWRFIGLRAKDEVEAARRQPVASARPPTRAGDLGNLGVAAGTGWKSTAAIVGTWCFVIVSNMLSFIAAPHDMACAPPMPSETAVAMVVIPLLFFGGFALFAKRSPFLSPWIAGLIDERLGAGSCERFIVRLKPLLLFAAGGLLSAAALVSDCWQLGAGNMNWTTPLFLASGSVAFAVAHSIMRFRRVPGV